VTRLIALLLALALPAAAAAQGADVAFGGLRQDTDLPVEVSADSLRVDQDSGRATFRGNVVIGQGEMRLTGAVVDVTYAGGAEGAGEIERLHAQGGVTFVSGGEAAEAREAVYTIASGSVVLTGDVVLTQGQNTLAGDRLTVDLESGTGVMEGRVRVIFQPEDE
jgi:lipopolysaccharide export system protein LptA